MKDYPRDAPYGELVNTIREDPTILIPGKWTYDYLRRFSQTPLVGRITGGIGCPVRDVILGGLYYGVGKGAVMLAMDLAEKLR